MILEDLGRMKNVSNTRPTSRQSSNRKKKNLVDNIERLICEYFRMPDLHEARGKSIDLSAIQRIIIETNCSESEIVEILGSFDIKISKFGRRGGSNDYTAIGYYIKKHDNRALQLGCGIPIFLVIMYAIWALFINTSENSYDRYDSLSPEGKNYVDDQMRAYDEHCARSPDC